MLGLKDEFGAPSANILTLAALLLNNHHCGRDRDVISKGVPHVPPAAVNKVLPGYQCDLHPQ